MPDIDMKFIILLVLGLTLGQEFSSTPRNYELSLDDQVDRLVPDFNRFLPTSSLLEPINFSTRFFLVKWKGVLKVNEKSLKIQVQRNGSCVHFVGNTFFYMPLYSDEIEWTGNYSLAFGWLRRYGEITLSTKPIFLKYNASFTPDTIERAVNLTDVRIKTLTTSLSWNWWPFSTAWQLMAQPMRTAITDDFKLRLREAVFNLVAELYF